MSGRQAVVLLSGGLDSSTVLAIAKSQGFECGALSFQYGQRHKPGTTNLPTKAKIAAGRYATASCSSISRRPNLSNDSSN
jgi:7-cyano-7-deazaguanine synthase in queuosine biosynthesis